MTGEPKKFDPDWCMRPGVHLAEEMQEAGITVRMVAKICGVEPAVIAGVLDGSVEITPQISLGLSRMGVSSQFWLNAERTYRDGLARGKKDVSDD